MDLKTTMYIGLASLLAFPVVLVATVVAAWALFKAKRKRASLIVGIGGLVALVSISYVYSTHVAGIHAGPRY